MAYHEMRLVLTKLLWHFDFELDEMSRGWAEGQRVFALWEKKPLELKVAVRA
jgi:cytochrome P450